MSSNRSTLVDYELNINDNEVIIFDKFDSLATSIDFEINQNSKFMHDISHMQEISQYDYNHNPKLK